MLYDEESIEVLRIVYIFKDNLNWLINWVQRRVRVQKAM